MNDATLYRVWIKVTVKTSEGSGVYTARAYDTGEVKRVTKQPRAEVGDRMLVWHKDWAGYEAVEDTPCHTSIS